MAGVAGPMLRRSKPQGTRFLLGLLAGEIAGSALLASALFGLGSLLAILIPLQGRVWLTAVAILVFGLLDMINRTPHIWRQVPQRFVRSIPPGRLGLVWGFDLALLFTTQKATSLTWVALAGVTLLQPNTAWPVLTTMAVVGVMAVAIRSVVFSLSGPSWQGDRSRPWFVLLRKVSGLGLAVLAVILAVQAV
jgi:hypothetical protein